MMRTLRMLQWLALGLAFMGWTNVAVVATTTAFVSSPWSLQNSKQQESQPQASSFVRSSSSALWGLFGDYNKNSRRGGGGGGGGGERYEQALLHNERRTSLPLFLTQRALQTFITLLISCRDPHTVKWLENTYGFINLETFHGTGALNLTQFPEWDTLFRDMLEQPNDVVVVSARRRGRGHGGWSKDNPYLEDRFVEFEIDIEPASLVSRMVSVRSQIANEWLVDLDTLVAATNVILTSYHERQNLRRQDESVDDSADCPSSSSSSTTTTFDNPLPQEEQIGSMDIGDNANKNNNNYPNTPSAANNYAYERNSMVYLNNKMTEQHEMQGDSSALRKGNFDLLMLLATQEAIHRVLRQYRQAGSDREVSAAWLRDFYIGQRPSWKNENNRDDDNDDDDDETALPTPPPRVTRYFDGSGKFGRADDFLEDLLVQPPSFTTLEQQSRTETVGLVDPLRIAEDILATRNRVAEDWKEELRYVASDHMQLQRAILAVRMGQPPVPRTVPSSPPRQPPHEPSSPFGEFE